jgi:ribonuclease HI
LEDSWVEMYTDGACKGNPGPGGWGVLLKRGEKEKELCGGEPHTTNNRMEMQAVIEGLNALTAARARVRVYTDSQYLKNGITQWLPAWKRKGWRTADNKPVKNIDLWQRLEALAAKHDIEWHWVRGHAGHDGNERADLLANRGVAQLSG